MAIEVEQQSSLGKQFGEAVGWSATRSKLVMDAFSKVDRALFVPPDKTEDAYENSIVKISENSSVSQPTLVALMVDHLGLTGTGKVLEVGTALGYTSAVLSHCADEIHTIDIDETLFEAAKERLANLGYTNVFTHQGDGGHGLPEHGPYDAIIITAAAKGLPTEIVNQLKVGGRLVVPIAEEHYSDGKLYVFQRIDEKRVIEKVVENVGFVPLISDAPGCWSEDDIKSLPSDAALSIRMIVKTLHITEQEFRTSISSDFGVDPNDDEAILESFNQHVETIQKRQRQLMELDQMEVVDTPPNDFTQYLI